MIKRVLLTIATTIAVLGLCTGYFYHTGKYERDHRNSFVCKAVNVAVRDSVHNRIITSVAIKEILGGSYIGMPLDSINLNEIELKLNAMGEILSSEAYVTDKSLEIFVDPRTAAVRFITERGHQFYCDATGYIFPVNSSVNTPVVTGKIPLRCGSDFKGYSNDRRERTWLDGILKLTSYIEKDRYWRELTSHLDINENGEIVLYPAYGNIHFLWGKPEDTEKKFEKAELWYKAIAPLEKAAKYTEVDLKYDNQIICR